MRATLAAAVLVSAVSGGCLGMSDDDPCGKARHLERYEDDALTYDWSWVGNGERMFAWYLDLENVCARSHVQLQFQSHTEELTHDPTVACGDMQPHTWGTVDWGIIYEDDTPEGGAGRYDESLEVGLRQAFPTGPASLQAAVVVSVLDEGDEESTAGCLEMVLHSIGLIADYREYKA